MFQRYSSGISRLGRIVLTAALAGALLVPTLPPAQAAESALVYPGGDGKLVYTLHANTGETAQVNKIPDYSRAGYKGGGVAIPDDVPVKITVSPGPGDDRAAIQSAIDYVEGLTPDSNGFRGAVLLEAGDYQVSNTLTIQASGVVLRGSGQGANGTVLTATRTARHDVIVAAPSGSTSISTSNTTRITTSYVGAGSNSFSVNSASGYAVGDRIFVVFTPNQTWIDDLCANCYLDSGDQPWTPSEYVIKYERVITGISGNTITIDSPTVQPIQNKYGGGEIQKYTKNNYLEQVGVENLRIVSVYNSSIQDENPGDPDHAYKGVVLSRVVDGWARGITGFHLSYATVSVENSSRITVQDSAYREPKGPRNGGWRYPFNLSGISSHVLFQRNFAEEGRHEFVTGSRVPGPNVFLDGLAVNSSSVSGPHHRWATGILFDNIKTNDHLAIENRGGSGTGHSWAGGQSIFWNTVSNEMTVDTPIGHQSYAIGTIGTEIEGSIGRSNPGVYRGYHESLGTHVDTRSLYLKQLEDRLGATGVNNVVIAPQLSGNIYDLLNAWRGDGPITNYLIDAGSPSSVNLALNKPVTFTDQDSNVATHAVDGNLSTRWSANVFPQAITVDLQAVYKIGATEVAPYQDRAYQYKVEVSTNGSTFTEIVNRTSNTTGGPLLSDSFAETDARYVRLTVTGVSGTSTTWSSINEFRVFAANLALNKSVTYTDQDSNVATQAVDGNLATRWSANVFPQSITVDLGATYYVGRTEVAPYQDRAYQYRVEVSTNGSTFTEVVNRTANTIGGPLFSDSFTGTNARYVRLTVTGIAGSTTTWSSINEFRVFAVPQPTVLSPTHDAYVRDGSFANDNYGNDTNLLVKEGATTGNNRLAHMMFDLSGISSVSSAKLRVYSAGSNAGNVTVYNSVDPAWGQGTITWNNQPAIGNVLSNLSYNGTPQYIEFDITSYVQTRLGLTLSLILGDSTGSDTNFTFRSKEGSNPPELVLVQ